LGFAFEDLRRQAIGPLVTLDRFCSQKNVSFTQPAKPALL
jgi:hypothetical protein